MSAPSERANQAPVLTSDLVEEFRHIVSEHRGYVPTDFAADCLAAVLAAAGRAALAARPNVSEGEIVHGISGGSASTWCCRRWPHAVAAEDRFTQDAEQVTCHGRLDTRPKPTSGGVA